MPVPLRTLRLFALATSALFGQLTIPAQTPSPAAKPSNATGQCKDGTYSTASSKSGACRGHNGVKDWYTASAPSSAPGPAPAAATPAAAAQPTAQQPPTSSKGPKANLATTPVAPGGGPGLVWVNTASNVYHCPNTDFYGKTKAGAYMSEADAKGKGARPNRGQTCK